VKSVEGHLLVFGTLRFPRGGAEAWRALEVDADALEGWPDLLAGGHLGPVTVEARLAAFAAMKQDQGGFEIAEAEATVVRGFLLEAGTLRWSRDIAATLRAAGDAGATGEMVFLQVDGARGVRLKIGRGGARFEAIDDDAGLQLLASAAALGALKLYGATRRRGVVPSPTRS
jgi:hypothetical protein